MRTNTAPFEAIQDTASRLGTRTEAISLAEIADQLAGINDLLHLIAEALVSPQPWNVKIT